MTLCQQCDLYLTAKILSKEFRILGTLLLKSTVLLHTLLRTSCDKENQWLMKDPRFYLTMSRQPTEQFTIYRRNTPSVLQNAAPYDDPVFRQVKVEE